jgi:demethoxyubiquinone hydroxylase (CLK1/Coq7/Cat5 family)
VTLAQLSQSAANNPELAKTVKKMRDDLERHDQEKAEMSAKAEPLEPSEKRRNSLV